MKQRLVCLCLVLVLLSVSVAFAAGVSTSKPVKITGYLLGSAPSGWNDVLVALNKKLQRDLNVTMQVNWIGWGDMQSKYPLVLAAGDDIDWIFTANWAYYAQEAAKGAFLEVTPDMLKKCMPKHYKATNPAAWKEAKINGKTYMIPTSTPDKKISCVIIRGDLRKKYGVPEVKTFADLPAYFDAIKKNEPGMLPMQLDSNFDINAPFGYLHKGMGTDWMDILATTGSGCGIVFDYEDPTGKLVKMTDPALLAQYKKAATIMKEWNAKDYFNKDVFANKVRSKDAFDQGRSAVGIGNSQDIQANLANARSKGWDAEIIPCLSLKGHYPADPFINNGVAVAARSKNPERTLMVLDKIMEDKAYNYLVYFGILGKNYIVKNGKIDLPAGLTADKNTYPPDAAGYWFTNKDQFKPFASWDDKYIALRKNLPKMLAQNVFAAFSPDTSAVKTEVANLNQAIVEYLQPIEVGAVPDVDAALATLKTKLEAAGIDKVLAEFTKQTQAYLASIK